MQITFLIGNGFDIGIGLHTRYEDFYEKYCCISETDSCNIKQFKLMLQDRNKDETKKIVDWADFETAFGEHSLEFEIVNKRFYLDRFENFVSNFNKYLELEETNVDYSNERAIAQTMKNAITKFYHIRAGDREDIENTYKRFNDTRNYNFISFNYTTGIDNCVKILSKSSELENNRKIGKVVHIHGYVDRNMIMGVNDVTQIANPDFANDADIVAEIVKPQQNSDARTKYEDEVNAIINSSNIICVYGMSMSKTDKKWWDRISNWLTGDDARKLVILTYDKEYNERFTFLQKRITDDTVRKFLSSSNLTDSKKNEIKNRIYVGANYNVFSMNLRKKEKAPSVTAT